MSPFDRNLGFRLGLAMQATDMPAAVTPEKTWNLEMASIQLYYYGRWFEADLTWVPGLPRLWQSYERVDNYYGGAILSNPKAESEYVRFALTGYPFRVFDLNLGITLGILHHRVDWVYADIDNGGSSEYDYSNLLYQSVVLGVTWRFIDRFRISMDLIIPFNAENSFMTVNVYQNHLVFKKKQSIPGFSFTFSAFLFRNLSLEAGYQFMVYELELEKHIFGTDNPFGQNLRFYSHRITFAVGYGFNLR